MMFSSFSSIFDCIGNTTRFSGGLTQNDWFTFPGMMGQTIYGPGVYNQAVFINSIKFRQLQTYQNKNYNLAWVNVAREDIRQFMNVFVSRMSNYMLVATFILNLAAASLFWAQNFDSRCPAFVVNFFWMSVVTSIIFLSIAIMFGIKGQNSSFINTMRLLTWEVRPENPSKYDHNYLEMLERWEKLGRAKSHLRPARMPVISGVINDAAGEVTGGNGSQVLEQLEPPTKDLIYLARFAHFMRLFVPYEIFAKYSIGIALISLSQGAAYFSLGSLSWSESAVYREVLACCMISLFVLLTVIIYADNYSAKSRLVQCLVIILFMWGPLTATLAVIVEAVPWLTAVCVCLSSLGQSLLFGGLCAFCVIVKQDTGQMTSSYVRGPKGQRFPGREEVEAKSGEDWRHGVPGTTQTEAPTRAEEDEEELRAEAVLWSVAQVVRGTLGLCSCVWMVLFIVTVLDALHLVGPTSLPVASVKDLNIKWPSDAFLPTSLACGQTEVFVANRYQAFRVDTGSGNVQQERCSQEVIITDLLAVCGQTGTGVGDGCNLMTLTSSEEPNSGAQLVDCVAFGAQALLQDPGLPSSVALKGGGNIMQNPSSGTLLALSPGGNIVEYGWDGFEGGWVPLWTQATVDVPSPLDSVLAGPSPEIYDIDTSGSQLFLFGRQAALPGGVTMQGVSFVESRTMQTGQRQGRYRLPTQYPDLVAGCAISEKSVIVITQAAGEHAKLLSVTLP